MVEFVHIKKKTTLKGLWSQMENLTNAISLFWFTSDVKDG
jgi:hypothetical protein